MECCRSHMRSGTIWRRNREWLLCEPNKEEEKK